MRPSLQQLCACKVTANLVHYRYDLHLLPSDLQILVANKVLERRPIPHLNELQILCQTVWKPTRLCLTGIPSLNVRGLEQLTSVSSLLKLDLSGCGWWLHDLSFLPGLLRLQCLNLRDCWHLSGDCLAFIQRKHGLIALPNNSKLLGKTNSILLSVLQGACGCSSKVIELDGEDKEKPIWLNNWEENGIVKFLQEASLFCTRPP